MRREPLFGQDLLLCADVWGHICELDPQQEGEFGHRNDAVAALGKHDHLVPVLLEELPAPALPPDRFCPDGAWLTLPPVGRRPREHEQGEHDVDPNCPRGFLGRMAQAPWLLTLLDTAVLDETAIIVVIKWLQGLLHRGIRQEDRGPAWPEVPVVPRAHHHRLDGVGLEVATVAVAPVLHCPVWIVSCPPVTADHLPSLQPFTPGGFALPMAHRVHPAPHGEPVAGGGQGSGVRGHRHVLLGRHDKEDSVLVQPPPIGARQEAAIQDHLIQAGVAGEVGAGCVTSARRDSVSCAWIGTTFTAKGILVAASIKTITFQP